ncbi:MAG: ribonuclease P protein component [Propionibacteriaceae bacterium]|jgi:ribonuclease P protein component|nr:ribonuclease P protein component [Propionibacteriaceae bacterium]
MLPQHLRLRTSADFASVVKKGFRVTRPALVLYARAADQPHFGVIVGRRVGNAVRRNRVKRVLRHEAGVRLSGARPMDVVVRALGSELVRQDLASAWAEAERRVWS